MSDGEHILVVVQSVDVRRQIVQAVGGLGLSIVEAAVADDGARLLDRGGIALLIVQGAFDVPGEAGLFLKARLRTPHVPGILIAERCDAMVLDIAARVGAAALLPSPADPYTLRDKARAALTMSRLTQGLNPLRDTLRRWEEDLRALEDAAAALGGNGASRTVHGLLALATRHMAQAFRQTADIALACAEDRPAPLCEVADCERLAKACGVLKEAAAALEETKKSFKSKQLGMLRTHIEAVLEHLR